MRELIQPEIWILRLGILSVFSIFVLIEFVQLSRENRTAGLLRFALAAWSAANLAFVVFLWFNHAGFSLNLEAMEGTILQHLERASNGQAVYPEPTPSYCALAYNPLFYFLTVPFAWVLGVKLLTLRVVAILGMLGIGVVMFGVTKRRTQSLWWGFISVGVFAAAYRVMDAYLDSAHSDSWMVCSALLGTLVLDQSRTRLGNLLGVCLLVCSFWFKQHGALFAIGGVLYLTLKEGPVRATPYWLVAILLGPLAYWFAGPWLFGSHFHYFTWTVPSQWTEITALMFPRFGGFILLFYGTLAAFTCWNIVREWKGRFKGIDIWKWQLVFAMATAFLGCLDPESSDNIFIPLGVFLIIEGIRGIHAASGPLTPLRGLRLEALALVLVFVQLGYDSRTVVVSRDAHERFAEFLSTLDSLQGSVYAPLLGQLERGFVFSPAVHLVSIEDMVRGPGRETRDNHFVARLLEPCVCPSGPAYIIANFRLHDFPLLAFLETRYVVETDFGDRFKSLRGLHRRFDPLWPRYLYRFDPARM